MERRAEFERKIASVQRRDSLARDSANIDVKSVDGCFSAVGLVALCGFFGASLGGCVGLPLMLIVGNDLPMYVVMTITGVLGATLATLNLGKQSARVASPQTRSQVQPDISAGALATDAEIEQALGWVGYAYANPKLNAIQIWEGVYTACNGKPTL
jgi:hypothetical protein